MCPAGRDRHPQRGRYVLVAQVVGRRHRAHDGDLLRAHERVAHGFELEREVRHDAHQAEASARGPQLGRVLDGAPRPVAVDVLDLAHQVAERGVAPAAPWQMGPLVPPTVISTMIELRGYVYFLFSTHHRRRRSLVVLAPTRTRTLPAVRGVPSAISISSSSVGLGSGRALLSAVKLGIWVTSRSGRSEMVIWPLRPKMGDHEWPAAQLVYRPRQQGKG